MTVCFSWVMAFVDNILDDGAYQGARCKERDADAKVLL